LSLFVSSCLFDTRKKKETKRDRKRQNGTPQKDSLCRRTRQRFPPAGRKKTRRVPGLDCAAGD
jgi:hypothetical protein